MNRSGTALSLIGENAGTAVGPFVMYPARAHASANKSAATLGDYLDAIYRRKWWILALVVAAIAITYFVSKRLPRLYEATATLNIDRIAPAGLVGAESLNQVAPDMDQFVSTHLKMLQSDAVLRPVATKFHLLDKPGANNVVAQLGPTRLAALKVSRPPNTYLIQISYRDRDPEKAAAVANGVAQSYIAHLASIRERDWESLAVTTRRQLAGLKEKMEQSNADLLAFQRRIGMVDPDDKTNVLSARLLQLNMDFAKAQADRAAKEAAYQIIRNGAPEAAEVSGDGEQLKRLLDRKNEALQKATDVQSIYAENHPEYRRAQAQLTEIDNQLRAAYKKAVSRAAAELREARLRESNLEQAYLASKAEADAVSSKSVECRLLRQRADADHTIYDELSRKVAEAEINAGLRNTPVRIADFARMDPKPASPNTPLNCAIAMLAALVIGCVAAVAQETRQQRIRSVEEMRAASGASVITELPAVRLWRGRRGVGMFSDQVLAGRPGDRDLSGFREEIRRLRNGLAETGALQRVRVIAVVSPGPGEGRSRVSSELAMAYAAIGRKTLLVDANLRSPVLHGMVMGAGPQAGLCTSLSGESRWREGLMRGLTPSSPDLLPSGAFDDRCADLLHQRLPWLVEEVAREYEIVIIDSPPFLLYSEGLDIVRSSDIVVAIARADVTKPQEFETMLRYLHRLEARVSSFVLNDKR